MRRSAPAAPTDTSPPAAVAAEIAVPPTGVKPAVASVAEFATELEPSATEFAVVAVAAPPIATAFVPTADESASVELAWKYLMPPPFTMLFTVLLMLVTLPLRFATLLLVLARLFATFDTLFETLFTFASSDCSWLTFTASVAFRPAATFVMRRSAPAAPTDTSPPAAVAAEIAVPPTGVKPAVASVLEFATEFEPNATEFAVVAVAAPPIATAFVPTADESASVELAWKYLMPPPFTMLFTVLLMLVSKHLAAAVVGAGAARDQSSAHHFRFD